MSENFYRAFEDKHRGSRDLIKGRLRAYIPYLKVLATIYPGSNAVDLGCGRGEWLEILKELHFCEKGVDLDSGMLSSCIENNLNVEQGDALKVLATLQDESQSIVSAFHLVEHITFEQLQMLVTEALRVLRPGGILIMETPNPENIVVATSNFYLDPTHQRPIPPMLLSFTAEFTGFARVKTVRLQESQDLLTKVNVNVSDVIGGVSPDYAVIAQKEASPEIFDLTDPVFAATMGVSLSNLLGRWENHFECMRAQSAQAQAQSAQAQAQSAQAQAQSQHAIIQSQQILAQIEAMLSSRSWRLTAPLRATNTFAKKLKGGLKRRTKSTIFRLVEWVNNRLLLRKVSFYIFRLFPGLKRRLKRVFESQSTFRGLDSPPKLNLTTRAKLIYSQLAGSTEEKGD